MEKIMSWHYYLNIDKDLERKQQIKCERRQLFRKTIHKGIQNDVEKVITQLEMKNSKISEKPE
jgi:hypothetical protein